LFSSPVVDRSSAGSRSATIPEQQVARDGAITVPFAGRVPVVGRTPPEIERVIVERLADKAIDPQALVTVTRNISNTVTLMGEAGPGARVPLTLRGDRLLDVIASGGGVRAPIQDIAVVLERGGRNLRVPMQAVLDDPSQNIYVQPGDVVTLVRDPQTFTAIGATGRNAVLPFETVNLTLDEALGKAGGLLDERADARGLFVVRYETPEVASQLPQASKAVAQAGGVPAIYHLDLRDSNALFLARRFPMRNKDIMYVSNAPLTEVQKVLTLVNLLLTPVITGITVQSVVK
jgi:polysaccharide export outer membrane protein